MDIFAEVARVGSFAAVAKARNVDPSSISRAIAGLETELGTRLFQRTTRRMSLTEAGERWLVQAVPLAEELTRLREQARSGRGRPAGLLRLTASVSFGQHGVMPHLRAFRERFPDVALECLFTDATLDLVADRIDLAIRLGSGASNGETAEKLADTRYHVVASPGYVSREGAPEHPADLARRSCLLFTLPAWRRRWRFRSAKGVVSEVPVQGDLVLSPAGALRDAALAGLGPALLADWLVGADLEAGDLIDLFPGYEATATSFDTAAWLVTPSRSHIPAKTRAMIDFLKPRFS